MTEHCLGNAQSSFGGREEMKNDCKVEYFKAQPAEAVHGGE